MHVYLNIFIYIYVNVNVACLGLESKLLSQSLLAGVSVQKVLHLDHDQKYPSLKMNRLITATLNLLFDECWLRAGTSLS